MATKGCNDNEVVSADYAIKRDRKAAIIRHAALDCFPRDHTGIVVEKDECSRCYRYWKWPCKLCQSCRDTQTHWSKRAAVTEEKYRKRVQDERSPMFWPVARCSYVWPLFTSSRDPDNHRSLHFSPENDCHLVAAFQPVYIDGHLITVTPPHLFFYFLCL